MRASSLSSIKVFELADEVTIQRYLAVIKCASADAFGSDDGRNTACAPLGDAQLQGAIVDLRGETFDVHRMAKSLA